MKKENGVMGAIARFVTRKYKLVFVIGIAVFVLALAAAAKIVVKTEIRDLLPADNPQVESYVEIDELFSGGGSIIITIEGDNRARMIDCANEYVEEVRSRSELMRYLRTISFGIDEDFVRTWGLMLQPAEDLAEMNESLAGVNLLPFVRALNDSFEETYIEGDAEEELSTNAQENDAVALLNQLEIFFADLHRYLEYPELAPPDDQGRNLAETFLLGERYGFNYDNTMLMFTLLPNFDAVDYDVLMPVMDEIREIEDEIQARFPDLVVGYSGEVPIQADEQIALSYDMMVPALVALVLILLLFVFSFRQLRSILFLLGALLIGIAMNYGFVGITIGEINMLTSLMAVLLIGLGVDYGIQIVANFNEYRREGNDPTAAMELTYQQAGVGVFLAAFTTAIAFFVMALTGTQAFAQFGIVLGTGIITCFLAMFFVLPACLLWFGKRDLTEPRAPKIDYGFLATLGRFTSRHRWVTIGVAGVITICLLVAAITLNDFDYNMMGLEPQDMPSMIQYKRIMEKFEITPFQSMVVSDSLEHTRVIVDALKEEPMVAEVASIAALLPGDKEQQERLVEIENIRNMPRRYSDVVYDASSVGAFADEIQRLEWNIIEIGDLSVAGLGDDNKILSRRNEMIREIFGAEVGKPGAEVFQKLINLVTSDPELYGRRLTAIDSHFAPAMDRMITDMSRIDRPLTIDDLPESIVKGYMDTSGRKNLVMVYPTDTVMDSKESMERFNAAMAAIDPGITGMAQIITSWMEEASVSTLRAGIYILIAVLIFLIATFRNLRYTLLAMAPLIVGMVWMLGIYPLLGFKINIINLVVIPLVIGMGIDFGIHLAHRFRVEQDIHTVYTYTGKAVFLSAFTTMIGFGSLGLIGKFPSIASMGVILFFGIASCLAAALLVLPALLSTGRRTAPLHNKGARS